MSPRGKAYGDSDVSRLLLRTRVVLQPLLELVRVAVQFLDRDQRRQFPARLQRRLHKFRLRFFDVFRPARIERQNLALFQHQLAEFLNPQILNQKLDARPVAVFLLAEPREHSRNRLRQRQQFFRRHKRIKQLCLIRHRPQPAADVHFETNLFFLPCRRRSCAWSRSGRGRAGWSVRRHAARSR